MLTSWAQCVRGYHVKGRIPPVASRAEKNKSIHDTLGELKE